MKDDTSTPMPEGSSPNEFERAKSATAARDVAEAAIEALRQKGGFFVEAVRATRMPMALTDPNLPGNPIVFANEAFVKLSGYSMKELLGQQPHFLNGPGTDPQDAARFQEALRSEQDDIIETVQYRKNGSRFIASVLISAFKDETGRTVNHFMSWLDVTRRAEAEDEVADMRVTQSALQDELRNTEILQELGGSLISEDNVQTIYEQILAAAIEIAHSKAGTVQMLDPATDELVMLATRGFSEETVDYFDRVDASSNTSCGEALRSGERAYFNFDPASEDKSTSLHVNDGVLSAQSTPLVSRLGKAIGMVSVHWGEPDHHLSKRQSRFLDLLARQAADVLEQRRSSDSLRKSEEKYRNLFESMDEAYAVVEVLKDDAGQWADFRFVNVNPAFMKHTTMPYPVGKTATQLLGSPNPRWTELYGQALDSGEPLRVEETEPTLGRTFDLNIFSLDRTSNRVAVLFTDITERKRAEESLRASERHSKILLAELQHRVRNTLAVVRSIAQRTAQNSDSAEDMLAHFQGRLDAFSRVQAALTRSADAKVDLTLLIEDELIAHATREGPQVQIDGPTVALEPKTAERLSLAIHELTTNAVKHGALIGESGRVEIRWRTVSREGGEHLLLTWKESGVELDGRQTSQDGFGMELLRYSLPYDLRAETKVEFEPSGLRFDLRMPLNQAA